MRPFATCAKLTLGSRESKPLHKERCMSLDTFVTPKRRLLHPFHS